LSQNEQLYSAFQAFFQHESGFSQVWNLIEGFVAGVVTKQMHKRTAWGRGAAIDANACDDVVQNVAVKLMKLRERPSSQFNPAKHRYGVDGISSWLAVICQNQVSDYCKRWRQAGRKVKVEAIPAVELNAAVDRSVNDGSRDFTAAIDDAELHQLVQECLAELSPPLRQVITMRFFDELKSRPIAAVIGTAPSTVTKRVQRGLEQLATMLVERGVPPEQLADGQGTGWTAL